MRNCSTWRNAAGSASPTYWKNKCGGCWRTSGREALVGNFAGQWLYLRNLESFTPDLRLFPDFDDNLRQAFRRETELFFESILREDRSVLGFAEGGLYVPQRTPGQALRHPARLRQPIPPRELGKDSRRGGLLRQGSILTVTSYATRTSPVIRGKWMLENILGTPPPPPPANVPALKDNTVSAHLTVRERLAEHRANRRLCQLPRLDGPRRVLAGKLRCGRPLAGHRSGPTDRCGRRPARRQQVHGRRRSGRSVCSIARNCSWGRWRKSC